MLRPVRQSIFLYLLIALATCCAHVKAEETPAESSTDVTKLSSEIPVERDSQGLDHVVMQLSWYPNFQFAGYYAAQLKGFYEEEGLDVELRHRNVDLLPPDAVLNGKADFGNATSDAILLRMKGEPIVALAVIMQHSPWCLLVREDSGITVPTDLVDKTVALDLSYQDMEILAMFKNEGIVLERMNIVRRNKNVKQLRKNIIDAKATYIGTHPFYLEEKGIPGRVIRPVNYGIDFYGETLITSEAQLRDHPKRVAAFRKASLRGWQYAMEHKAELIEHILTVHLVDKDKARVAPSRQNLIDEARLLDEELMHPKLVEIGHMNPQRWQRIADSYTEMGFAEPLDAATLDRFIYRPDMPVPADYTWLRRGIVLSLTLLLTLLCFSSVLVIYNRNLAKAVALQTTELTTANLHLENQNVELERFAYTISHELRSPLVTIKSFCGLLQKDIEDQDSESIEEDLECIENASDTMHLLLSNLLELSRIGLVVNETKSVSLLDISEQVIALMRGEISEKNVEVEIAISKDLPEVEVDPVRFAEVLQNLIENAIKYMGDQPDPRINIGARYDDNQLVCFVQDNGIGVEPAFQKKVFGLFEQLDAKASGTGVGLALVERIIKSHGGTVWVESKGKGHGSTFLFTLDTKQSIMMAG